MVRFALDGTNTIDAVELKQASSVVRAGGSLDRLQSTTMGHSHQQYTEIISHLTYASRSKVLPLPSFYDDVRACERTG